MKFHTDKETGMPVPSDPAEVPSHRQSCGGCAGDGYKVVVGPATNFEWAAKPCDGVPVPNAAHRDSD